METTTVLEQKDKTKKSDIKKSFPVTGMTCAACASSVESILSHTEGVQKGLLQIDMQRVQNKARAPT